MDIVQKIRELIEKRYEYWKEKEFNSHSIESEIRMSECQHLLLMVNSLQEESVSEELVQASIDFTKHFSEWHYAMQCFQAGAKWQKEKDDEEKVLIYKHGFEDCKEQMIAKAIDAHCFGFQGAALFSFRLPADNYLVGSEVKVIVIKED